MTISRLYLEDSIHSHAPQDYLLESNGEGGIRTHAPFRTNGFQDRLVMTTSIPLRICFARISAKKILPSTFVSVNNYFNFFSFFSFQMFEVPCFKYISAISISSGVVILMFSYAPSTTLQRTPAYCSTSIVSSVILWVSPFLFASYIVS